MDKTFYMRDKLVVLVYYACNSKWLGTDYLRFQFSSILGSATQNWMKLK